MEIAELRVEINNIDNEIVKLLLQRMEVATKTCEHCKTTIRENDQKKKLINRLNRIEGQIRGIKGMVENDVLKPHMENIYRCIMDETKLVEEKLMEA